MAYRTPAEPDGLAALLADHSEAVADLTRRLRKVTLEAHPELSEKVHPGWHGLGFRHPTRGYVGALFPRDEDVGFGFEHGAGLPDPHGLLRGDGRRLRYLRFAPTTAEPSDDVLVEYLDLAIDG